MQFGLKSQWVLFYFIFLEFDNAILTLTRKYKQQRLGKKTTPKKSKLYVYIVYKIFKRGQAYIGYLCLTN